MKNIGSLLLVSVFAGAITLGAYKLFFEKTKYAIVNQEGSGSIIQTSFTPTSAKGAGINEVDFTSAAENTVNAVVHVKKPYPKQIAHYHIRFFLWLRRQCYTPGRYGIGRYHFPGRLYCNQQSRYSKCESIAGYP